MGFYINFCTNVMSGLTLLCADLRFGLSPASSPLQSPFRSSFSLLLDFLTSPLLLKVQSSAISRPFWTFSCLSSSSKSNPPLLLDFLLPLLRFKVQSSSPSHSFWTSSCLPSASKSNPPLLLTPFGLPRASPPLQGPILLSFSLLLDFLLPLLCLKVQSSDLSRSFWTSSCLLSTSRSNPPLFLTPFGLPPASPPLQSPILLSFSLLLDFRLPPLRFKVQSSTLPLPTTQKRRIAKQSASPIPLFPCQSSANSTK